MSITLEEVKTNVDRNVSMITEVIKNEEDGYYRIVGKSDHPVGVRCEASEEIITSIIGESIDLRLTRKWIYDSILFAIEPTGDIKFRSKENAEKALQHIKNLLIERFENGEIKA